MLKLIKLTQHQQQTISKIIKWSVSDIPFLIFKGYSGTGKTTLLGTLTNILPNIKNLTATTNKATEAIENSVAMNQYINQLYDKKVEILTIFKLFKLVPIDRREKSKISLRQMQPIPTNISNQIIIIDEISMFNNCLIESLDYGIITLIDFLENIHQDYNVKFILVGDPCQLPPVATQQTSELFDTNNFNLPVQEVSLTQIVRQENDVLKELNLYLREYAEDVSKPITVKDNGKEITIVNQEKFDELIKQEFTRPEWNHFDSKILSYDNSTILSYTKNILALVKQSTDSIKKGDYLINNSYVKVSHKYSLPTESVVQVTDISDYQTIYLNEKSGIAHPKISFKVRKVTINGTHNMYLFSSYNMFKKYAYLRDTDNYRSNEPLLPPIDLRHQYACTIHKSQGSTYDTVFLHTTKLFSLFNKNSHLDKVLYAKLLYVALTRAKKNIVICI